MLLTAELIVVIREQALSQFAVGVLKTSNFIVDRFKRVRCYRKERHAEQQSGMLNEETIMLKKLLGRYCFDSVGGSQYSLLLLLLLLLLSIPSKPAMMDGKVSWRNENLKAGSGGGCALE